MVKFNDKKSQELLKGQLSLYCQNLAKYDSKQSSQNLVTRVHQLLKSLTKSNTKIKTTKISGKDGRLARERTILVESPKTPEYLLAAPGWRGEGSLSPTHQQSF